MNTENADRYARMLGFTEDERPQPVFGAAHQADVARFVIGKDVELLTASGPNIVVTVDRIEGSAFETVVYGQTADGQRVRINPIEMAWDYE